MDDWSSTMTEVHVSLKRAENYLRLIHMNEKNKETATAHLLKARALMLDLIDWCDE